MNRFVVDASIVIKWFIPEIHAKEAVRLLRKEAELLCPDLLLIEIGNVLWKKSRSGEVSIDVANQILIDMQALPLQIYGSEILLNDAWAIANQYDRTFYDSLYLALAKIEKCSFVSADFKLYSAIKDRDIGYKFTWVEDI